MSPRSPWGAVGPHNDDNISLLKHTLLWSHEGEKRRSLGRTEQCNGCEWGSSTETAGVNGGAGELRVVWTSFRREEREEQSVCQSPVSLAHNSSILLSKQEKMRSEREEEVLRVKDSNSRRWMEPKRGEEQGEENDDKAMEWGEICRLRKPTPLDRIWTSRLVLREGAARAATEAPTTGLLEMDSGEEADEGEDGTINWSVVLGGEEEEAERGAGEKGGRGFLCLSRRSSA
jgi:hypothetical protein